eukprot:FR743630.1.p3 GENE.FR743630.1~~FR743630.1.p3  ORF type:complete len:106 (-),score=19.67 FR743630.1:807-1124(-)
MSLEGGKPPVLHPFIKEKGNTPSPRHTRNRPRAQRVSFDGRKGGKIAPNTANPPFSPNAWGRLIKTECPDKFSRVGKGGSGPNGKKRGVSPLIRPPRAYPLMLPG